jgi:uncharacterized linocin/CFP29 family protein
MSDDVPRLPWTDEQWTTVQRIVQEAAGKARVASSFLPLVGPLLPGQTTVPTLRRYEDHFVFNHKAADDPLRAVKDPWTVKGTPNDGLEIAAESEEPVERTANGDVDSKKLVRAIAAGIQGLEGNRHYGPFACVLGRDLFLAANSPSDSMVFPSDRILPFLEGGPLRRSSVLPADKGLIVALAGSPVDLVVASDVHVKFLQITSEPCYVVRVSERFVLRIKQANAICRLNAEPQGGGQPVQGGQGGQGANG